VVLAGIRLNVFRVACKVLFSICAENSVDNTRTFQLLLSSICTAFKAFSASHPVPPARRMGVHKKSAGDMAGTADPSCHKRHSPPGRRDVLE